MTDNKEIDGNGEKLGSALPKDFTGPTEIHSNTALTDGEFTKTADGEPCDKEQELSFGNEKETRALQLLGEINNLKSSRNKWKKKIPARNNLLPVTSESIINNQNNL